MGTSGTPPQYVIVDRLGAFFYWTRFVWQQGTIRQWHCDLSDQSALDIRVRIRVGGGSDLELRRITNFTEGNALLKERPQTITNKIKLHILGVAMYKLGN